MRQTFFKRLDEYVKYVNNNIMPFQKGNKLGLGRVKGVLNPATIARIQTKQAMQDIIQKHAGFIINNLLMGSANLDTSASKELLERTFGKVPQGVQMQVATFSLKELSEYREKLKNPETKAIETLIVPDIINEPDKTSD